ncbi:aspartyl-phosphate phosphatase Spo0E family protein [Aquibacillus sp. 3ASR75-11]|uniref:Aspartyl-phosphate phosphatase Spo0E family protein n=2 Tax=Terrihalobacillus insolitus TaxID=2950438 RepID=A0A9X3WR40_9BACI|nr:aspartyl-phosphate phosphatase Spo0E family protein [Terrihalobacillus insolitus]
MKYGLTHHKTIQESKRLDKLINIYQKEN